MTVVEKYEISKNARALRWDWLNILALRYPYTVYKSIPRDRHPLSVHATLRSARRAIRQDRLNSHKTFIHEEDINI